MKTLRYAFELPVDMYHEFVKDATSILEKAGYEKNEIPAMIDELKNEKLVNMVGDEEGLLDYNKYMGYFTISC